MKLLHLIAGGVAGGAETYAQDAIIGLSALGLEQMVVCRPHPLAVDRLQAAGIAVIPFHFDRWSRPFAGRRAIAHIVQTRSPDLIHAWMGRAASFVGDGPTPAIGWFGGYYDRKNFRHVDAGIGVTHDLVRHIVRQGLPPTRAHLVHTFGTLPASPPVSRAAFATPEDARLLLVLSRMHWKKGIEDIITALQWLPSAYLWLAGDGPEKAKYQRLAAALKLGDRVRFLGWRTDRQALLDACDVCVLPSRYEPFGTVIAEAWAARKPLVVTRTDGARQYVTDRVNGLICNPSDPVDLASAIGELLRDDALRRQLIDHGRAAYAERFSRDEALGALLGVYENVVRAGKRPALGSVRPEDDRGLTRALSRELALLRLHGSARRTRDAARLVGHYLAQDWDHDLAVDAGALHLLGGVDLLRHTPAGPRVVAWSEAELNAGLTLFPESGAAAPAMLRALDRAIRA